MATQNIDLETTISALQKGLTSIPAEQAVAVIDSWQQQLEGTDLAEDLGQLKSALVSGTANGTSLAEMLTDIGEDTSEAATTANGDVAAKVKQLGQLLSQAGKSLK